MSVQTVSNCVVRKPVKMTVKQALIQVLSEGKFLTLNEIQHRLQMEFNLFSGEASISARWRELEGMHKQSRVRAKSNAWEYRLVR
ncbi:hypothetical protein D5018_03855 [Parashewanella curva]|uniref:Uncharacterized protein n=1 Tax=Parashewanella curva TaxID=2338552 RepID=A0A3L8PZU9_9GAMM|nr:hypothetical protein [Parashewanella curva]RLV60986.1 hypothetical protein D5018_03855 [Parashewanella curva]